MNIVPCSENCLWQSEGYCMLNDLTLPPVEQKQGAKCEKCRFFAERL